MFSLHSLGEVTLSLSVFIYLIWFTPQLLLTLKNKDTGNLSLFMHGFLFVGYTADLIYGFGRHMEWQYRLVTMIGLASLLVQHFQFWIYGLHKRSEKYSFFTISAFIVFMLAFAIYSLFFSSHTKIYYDSFGMVSNVCWFSFMIPQILKNYRNKSTAGLSLEFVLISILISVLDIISTWALGWDFPSKIGTPLSFLKKLILLYQFKLYNSQEHKQIKLAHS